MRVPRSTSDTVSAVDLVRETAQKSSAVCQPCKNLEKSLHGWQTFFKIIKMSSAVCEAGKLHTGSLRGVQTAHLIYLDFPAQFCTAGKCPDLNNLNNLNNLIYLEYCRTPLVLHRAPRDPRGEGRTPHAEQGY